MTRFSCNRQQIKLYYLSSNTAIQYLEVYGLPNIEFASFSLKKFEFLNG